MKQDYVYFQTRDELLRLQVEKIVYFEADGNYTQIVTVNNLRTVVGLNLAQMELKLSDDLGEQAHMFMRIGKRFIINMHYIYLVNTLKQNLILSDYEQFAFKIGVSREALKRVKELTARMATGRQVRNQRNPEP